MSSYHCGKTPLRKSRSSMEFRWRQTSPFSPKDRHEHQNVSANKNWRIEKGEKRKKAGVFARLEKWRNKVPYFLLTAHFSSSSPTILPRLVIVIWRRYLKVSEAPRSGGIEIFHWMQPKLLFLRKRVRRHRCVTGRKFFKLKYRMFKMKTKNWNTYFEKKKSFVYVKIKSVEKI